MRPCGRPSGFVTESFAGIARGREWLAADNGGKPFRTTAQRFPLISTGSPEGPAGFG